MNLNEDTSQSAKNTDDLNVDFENFSVPKEKSEQLRSSVQKVKELGIVDIFKGLVQELGFEEVSSQNDQVAGLIKAKNPRVFKYPVSGSETETPKLFEIFQFEQELRATLQQKAVLEVSFLPKDKDFVLFYVDPSFLDNWDLFFSHIAEVVKESEKMKNDRQKHFKKFKKETPAYEEEPSE